MSLQLDDNVVIFQQQFNVREEAIGIVKNMLRYSAQNEKASEMLVYKAKLEDSGLAAQELTFNVIICRALGLHYAVRHLFVMNVFYQELFVSFPENMWSPDFDPVQFVERNFRSI